MTMLRIHQSRSAMSARYRVVPIDELFSEPNLFQASKARVREVASRLEEALNEMAASDWELVTTYRGTTNTLFIFHHAESQERGRPVPPTC
jgi:hypothetical protein